jgi:hypothetical protein
MTFYELIINNTKGEFGLLFDLEEKELKVKG